MRKYWFHVVIVLWMGGLTAVVVLDHLQLADTAFLASRTFGNVLKLEMKSQPGSIGAGSMLGIWERESGMMAHLPVDGPIIISRSPKGRYYVSLGGGMVFFDIINKGQATESLSIYDPSDGGRGRFVFHREPDDADTMEITHETIDRASGSYRTDPTDEYHYVVLKRQ